MAWLKVSGTATLGTRFMLVRGPWWGGSHGQTYHGYKWRCTMCGREGYGTEQGPHRWADACRRGHAPCGSCGALLTLKLNGHPRIHTRCPQRDRAA